MTDRDPHSSPDVVSWFDDDQILERELKAVLGMPGNAPVIAGYGQLRELARGGQGVVYSALQLGTKRVVAVKVLREGPSDGARGVRRFEREVDLAASLAHPNVVALFDSGTTPDGRPFLVMELVDGPTIDHAPQLDAIRGRDVARADLDRVVELLAQVCDGVAYAHRRGVVHRDLKPSNIRLDRDGRPKVLDFGLAKNLDGGAGALTLTASGSGATFLGSLPWASPEQALGRNDDIDVRSDVYALGVIAYQLLTGRFPYDVESDLRSTLNTIVHVVPIAPRRLIGISQDLETIVLRCLQKDQERRYQSAADLARDLRRYLAGEAIEARRDSTWYTLRMTARRHRLAVVATALVLVSLVAGLAVSLSFWRLSERQALAATDAAGRADAARQLAEQQKQSALESARRAESAMRFFAETMVAVDPNVVGRDVKMIDVVKRASQDLLTRFADDPDAKSFYLIKLIEILRNFGDHVAALELAQAAVTTAETAWGKVDSRSLFARANLALILHRVGRSTEALPILEADAALVRGDATLRNPSTGHVFTNLGFVLLALDRVDDAEAAFREAIAIGVSAERESEAKSLALETLAAIAGYRGKPTAALGLLRESLPLRVAALGPEHLLTLRCANNLAFYLGDLGEHAEAEAILRENVAIARRRLGDRHLDTLSAINNHAHHLEMLGRLDEAHALLTECLEGRIAMLGEEAAHTLITMSNLATLTHKRNDVPAAEALFRRSIEIATRTQGPEHTDVLIKRNNLARLLVEDGRVAEAVATMREVVEAAAKRLGEDHLTTTRFRCNLGTYLNKAGETATAEVELRHTLRVLEAGLGAANQETRSARARLAEVLRTSGRAAEADALEPAAKTSDGR